MQKSPKGQATQLHHPRDSQMSPFSSLQAASQPPWGVREDQCKMRLQTTRCQNDRQEGQPRTRMRKKETNSPERNETNSPKGQQQEQIVQGKSNVMSVFLNLKKKRRRRESQDPRRARMIRRMTTIQRHQNTKRRKGHQDSHHLEPTLSLPQNQPNTPIAHRERNPTPLPNEETKLNQKICRHDCLLPTTKKELSRRNWK